MSAAPEKSISDVITDFLSTAPSLEAIAAYRLPDDLQQRAHALLDKNREGLLSEQDRAEMEEFRHVDHLLTLMKAKARIRLQAQS